MLGFRVGEIRLCRSIGIEPNELAVLFDNHGLPGIEYGVQRPVANPLQRLLHRRLIGGRIVVVDLRVHRTSPEFSTGQLPLPVRDGRMT